MLDLGCLQVNVSFCSPPFHFENTPAGCSHLSGGRAKGSEWGRRQQFTWTVTNARRDWLVNKEPEVNTHSECVTSWNHTFRSSHASHRDSFNYLSIIKGWTLLLSPSSLFTITQVVPLLAKTWGAPATSASAALLSLLWLFSRLPHYRASPCSLASPWRLVIDKRWTKQPSRLDRLATEAQWTCEWEWRKFIRAQQHRIWCCSWIYCQEVVFFPLPVMRRWEEL